MAEWSKALQLTARYFSTLPGFDFRPGHMKKLLVRFAPPFTTASSGFSLIKTETGLIIVYRLKFYGSGEN